MNNNAIANGAGESNGRQFFSMKDICKSYHVADEEVQVLHNINLTIERGEYLSILGPSGSGKSTFMNIIGCLDTPTSGEYILDGELIESLDEIELARIRGREIGFIFQNSQLLPRIDAQKNVELPLIYAGVPPRERARRAKDILERVGLAERRHHYSNQLSGGQQQRVAIARALVTNPTLLLADEPTGALDQKTGRQVMKLFQELNDEGRTIIMITHDRNIAQYANKMVTIIDGVLSEKEDALEDA
ncbi:MAG: ABC transporter ATP-binding protein [Clostridia bacterium]|nr:ABC transporter ATP-binding protein [Clostridia bacterium]